MKKILFYLIITVTVSIGFSSCNAFLEIDAPIDQIPMSNIYKDKASIKAALNGIYVRNSTSHFPYFSTLPLYMSAIVDDAVHKQGHYNEIIQGTYNENSKYVSTYWSAFYTSIYNGNLFLEGLAGSDPTLLSDKERAKYIAEVKFFRAYSHLALTILYGSIPFITTADVSVTRDQEASSREVVLHNVVADLLDAEKGLDGYDIENVYVSVHAVRALLARTYLYQEKWAEAIIMSNKVIKLSGAILEPDLSDVFLRKGKEAVMKFTSIETPSNYYINFTRMGYLGQGTSQNNLFLREELLSTFEEGDDRRDKWVGSAKKPGGIFNFLSTKYKQLKRPDDVALAEDFTLLRFAEQFLISAEAKIETNDLAGAEDDLNTIRNRAGLHDLEDLTKGELTLALHRERRIELFFEEYHRWADLSRWGMIDDVLGAITTKDWKSRAKLLPIPQTEMHKNPNLIQNDGYGK